MYIYFFTAILKILGGFPSFLYGKFKLQKNTQWGIFVAASGVKSGK